MATAISWEDDESGELLVVQFDVLTSLELEDTATVTEHPVERGLNVSDSVRKEPERITVEGVVTNIPHAGNPGFSEVASSGSSTLEVPTFGAPVSYSKKLDVPDPPLRASASGLLQAGISALGSAVFGGPNRTASLLRQGPRSVRSASASTVQRSGGVDRVRDVYDSLLLLQERGARCVVTTRLREYFDMVVERVAAPQPDGDYGRFQVDLKRVRVVSAETTAAPRPAEARGVAGKAAGSQATKKDKNADKKDELRSTLYDERHPS